MRQHLHEAAGQLLVFPDPDTVLPLRLAFQGVRFRLPLDRETVKQGLVGISDSLPSYLPLQFPLEQIRLLDAAGQPIPFQTQKVSQTVETAFGRSTVDILCGNLGAWFRAQRADARDHLLFTVLDWEQGVFQLDHEPHQQHVPARRAARNRLLADLFYEMLERAANEEIYAHEAVPTVYARLLDKGGYPPDHWIAVLQADERLNTDGWRIHYRDGQSSLLDLLVGDWSAGPHQAPSRPVSKEQGAQVYRFNAALFHRSNLWRTIEIQGKQSLAELNGALRGAFNHDTWDHLGGFWKLVPRGAAARSGARQRTRYREVKLGDVEPGSGGPGAGIKIAGLGLATGDELKYVYDFGDWIEHRLTLEAIAPPQARVKYPREAGRNAPQYADCTDCQQRGRQTVAKYLCLECSNRRSEDVLLCAACAEQRHEEHSVEEIVY